MLISRSTTCQKAARLSGQAAILSMKKEKGKHLQITKIRDKLALNLTKSR